MTKTHFRISLYPDSNFLLCERLAVLAAMSNGGSVNLTMEQLKTVADGNILEFPHANSGCVAELIGGHLLHIDRKIGEEYKTVLAIEQVEILEMPAIEEPEEFNGIVALAE